jgi:hypothetical protein
LSAAAGSEGFIYLAEVVGRNAVKIGFSRNPEQRIDHLRRRFRRLHQDRRIDLRLMGYFPADLRSEKDLHNLLARFRNREFKGHETYDISVLDWSMSAQVQA